LTDQCGDVGERLGLAHVYFAVLPMTTPELGSPSRAWSSSWAGYVVARPADTAGRLHEQIGSMGWQPGFLAWSGIVSGRCDELADADIGHACSAAMPFTERIVSGSRPQSGAQTGAARSRWGRCCRSPSRFPQAAFAVDPPGFSEPACQPAQLHIVMPHRFEYAFPVASSDSSRPGTQGSP